MIDLLVARNGVRTLVAVEEGDTFTVVNIAWGYDLGDEYAHVTTNASPFVDDLPIDVFSTDRVTQVRDEATGEVLYSHG